MLELKDPLIEERISHLVSFYLVPYAPVHNQLQEMFPIWSSSYQIKFMVDLVGSLKDDISDFGLKFMEG